MLHRLGVLIALLLLVGCGSSLVEKRMEILELLYENAEEGHFDGFSLEKIADDTGFTSSQTNFIVNSLNELEYIKGDSLYSITGKGMEYYEKESSRDDEKNEARGWGLWLTIYGAILAGYLAQKSAPEDNSGHLERIIELLEKKDIQ